MSAQPFSNVSNNICIEPTKRISELKAVKAVDELKDPPSWIALCDKLALQAKAGAIKARFSNHPYLFTKQNVAKRQMLRPNPHPNIQTGASDSNPEAESTICDQLKLFDDAMEALGDEIDVHYSRVLFSPCFSYNLIPEQAPPKKRSGSQDEMLDGLEVLHLGNELGDEIEM